jgi:predicted thioesterase
VEAIVEEDVTAAMTASELGSGDVPVLATPAVLALAERAAIAALRGRLPPETTTVGTWAEVHHVAPTPVGAKVHATARLEKVDGRRLDFAFSVSDPAGEVARGTHTRILVGRDAFIASATDRLRG